MRLKKAVTIIGSAMIVLVIFMIYSAKDLIEFSKGKGTIDEDLQNNKWLHFESRIKQIENDLSQHHNAVHEIKAAMQNMLQPSSSTKSLKNASLPAGAAALTHNNNTNINAPKKFKLTITEMLYESNCPFQINFVPHADVQMLDLYKKMQFDNFDGGVWKQGWRIEVDEKDWNRHNKLKVYVVPHSHNDPGWVKTIEEYYLSQTKHILNNMLVKLPEDRRRKFIWAEISYFSMWWDDISEDERETVKKLLKNNQLEIVTGGWVMNDEANAHWISVVQQLTEGHQWLQQNLNYTPQSSWSIDPFGMSMTQPYLLKEMGLHNLLIQRVHYSVKKELAKNQQLEFRWRQLWDATGKTDLLTHLMPFYSYDIPHTCGPDPKICCQFDFKRLPGHGLVCPWKISPQEITEKNIIRKAGLLLDQYRKKSKLYKTNVLMVPLGDDFRYDHITEWDVQFDNYQRLFDHMNSNLDLNVQAQFGTLTDYFEALEKERKLQDFPVLSGDFFTYADRDDHYWSGYYTSRPFYKRMDRILLSYMRTAETILALAHLSGKPGSVWIGDREVGLEKLLSEARKSLALFQHHDGITGTAKDHVVIDYGKKMLAAITSCQHVIQHSAHILLHGKDAENPDKNALFYNVDDVRHSHDAIGERYQITIGPELRTKRVAIFNSLTFSRAEVVTFYVSTPYVEEWQTYSASLHRHSQKICVLPAREIGTRTTEVKKGGSSKRNTLNVPIPAQYFEIPLAKALYPHRTDPKGRRILSQISPIFEYGSTMSQTKYQLSFIANIPALGLVSYVINALWEYEAPAETVHATIKIYNQYGEVLAPTGFTSDHLEVSQSASEFTLQNGRITASFNTLGLLKAIKTGVHTTPVHLDFVRYGVRNAAERSGAYLFLPDGEAIPVPIENTVVNIFEGPVLSAVTVQLPYVHHTVTLYHSTGADSVALEIQNVVDIAKTSNFELAMRLSTNINNQDEFFTDVNGYEIVRRKRFPKLPLQANYYPMPSIAYIQDDITRLTVVSGSPLGCSSLKEGQLEVMLDRRLNQDDNLGMGQAVLDNHPTKHVFRVMLERKTHTCQATAKNHPAGFPSLSAHVTSLSLLNPYVRLLRTEDDDTTSQSVYFNQNDAEFGVDFSIPVFRTNVLIRGKDNYVGFVLHRQFVDVCYADRVLLKQFPISPGTVNITALFPSEAGSKLHKASLSFLLLKNELPIRDDIPMCPMEIQAFVLQSKDVSAHNFTLEYHDLNSVGVAQPVAPFYP